MKKHLSQGFLALIALCHNTCPLLQRGNKTPLKLAEVDLGDDDWVQLAMITIFQFAEGLSDRAAADAVRIRIGWKYALGLELVDPGFDATVMVEFRMRLNASDQARLLFETLLERLREAMSLEGATAQARR